MNYKCVIADLDGTLLHSDKSISSYTIEILEKLVASGVYFVTSTGRAFNSVPDEVKRIKGIKYHITSNGVVIRDGNSGEITDASFMSKSSVEGLLELARTEGFVAECFVGGQPYISKADFLSDKLCYCNPNRFNYVKKTRIAVDDIYEFGRSHIDTMECVNLTMPPERMTEIWERIASEYKDVYITTSECDLLEISSINSGKDVGIKKVCELLDISPEEIVAFGDNNNDLEMLKLVGLGISMGNSTKKCIEASDKCVLSNDEDGVAKEIEQLFSLHKV